MSMRSPRGYQGEDPFDPTNAEVAFNLTRVAWRVPNIAAGLLATQATDAYLVDGRNSHTFRLIGDPTGLSAVVETAITEMNDNAVNWRQSGVLNAGMGDGGELTLTGNYSLLRVRIITAATSGTFQLDFCSVRS